MCVYLRAKFEVSSITLTSFRQEGNFTPPPAQNQPLKSPPRLGLKLFDLSFNELTYDCRVLSVFIFPTNRSAVLLKHLLSFSVSTFSAFGLGYDWYTMYYFPYIIFVF